MVISPEFALVERRGLGETKALLLRTFPHRGSKRRCLRESGRMCTHAQGAGEALGPGGDCGSPDRGREPRCAQPPVAGEPQAQRRQSRRLSREAVNPDLISSVFLSHT